MSTRSNRSLAFLHVVVAAVTVCVALEAAAEAPEIIRVQGVVTQLQGGPVADGNYVFLAEIFDVAVGGSPLFSATVTAAVVAGAYSLPVAPTVAGELKDALSGSGPRFVQITVVQDAAANPINETLLPRQQLASVPYALGASELAPLRELVDTHDVDDDAVVEFALPAGFTRFEIEIMDLYPVSTSPVEFHARVSTDGGTSFFQGAGDYRWVLHYARNGFSGHYAEVGDSIQLIRNHPNEMFAAESTPGRAYNGTVTILNLGDSSSHFTLLVESAHQGGDSDELILTHGTGQLIASTDPVDAIRFDVSSGNLAGGQFRLYGLR